jgi:hypothetical protein
MNKLIKELEALIESRPASITLHRKKYEHLLKYAKKEADRRRNKDTKRMRMAMYRASASLNRIALDLDNQRVL